ncbi:hypothetical protein ACQPU1_12755 [Clostridium paraputrificum]|uniref:hypothetical protein n=1 Tax=Clostridium paraputrificum TaxID=29363 RepID=UPI003D34DD86
MINYPEITLDDFNLGAEFNEDDQNFIQVDGGTSLPCTIVYTIIGISSAMTSGGENFSEYSCHC